MTTFDFKPVVEWAKFVGHENSNRIKDLWVILGGWNCTGTPSDWLEIKEKNFPSAKVQYRGNFSMSYGMKSFSDIAEPLREVGVGLELVKTTIDNVLSLLTRMLPDWDWYDPDMDASPEFDEEYDLHAAFCSNFPSSCRDVCDECGEHHEFS